MGPDELEDEGMKMPEQFAGSAFIALGNAAEAAFFVETLIWHGRSRCGSTSPLRHRAREKGYIGSAKIRFVVRACNCASLLGVFFFMKTSKLPITALCAALALVSGQLARAQGPEDSGPPMLHHGPPNITERLTHALNLTDAQKAQVQAKVAAVQPQLDAIRKQAHEQADAIIKQLHEQIRPLLNAEQQKRLDAIQTLRDTRPEGPE